MIGDAHHLGNSLIWDLVRVGWDRRDGLGALKNFPGCRHAKEELA